MKKDNTLEIYEFKYKNKSIILKYSNYKNLRYYVGKVDGKFIICINNKFSGKIKSNILHKAIKVCLRK